MASVMVFVDDAVRAELPHVCVKDGVPTRDALSINQEVGNRAGLGVAWLLSSVRFNREDIDISLDASRRWVTLANVHPEFVRACEVHQASRPHRT